MSPSLKDESPALIQKNYLAFLNKLTVDMYNNIPKFGEPIIDLDALNTHKICGIQSFINCYKRNRGLLERKSDNLFTFSHRSIFEYFLAINIQSIENFTFDGNLNQAYRFLVEMYTAGCSSTFNLFKKAPEQWYYNMEAFQSPSGRITYTNNPGDGLIFEFVNYGSAEFLKQLNTIVDTMRNLQRHIYQLDRIYVVHKIIKINVQLQPELQENI